MEKYILAIDQSTSATKVMFFTQKAELVHRVSIAHQQYYPQPGFVEHDGDEIFNNLSLAIRQLQEETQIAEEQIEVISITNQRETSIIWNQTTGKPIANAAVWQCQRGIEICNELKGTHSESIQDKTGLIIDPYFSASKLKWMIDDYQSTNQNTDNLLAGTMDSWLLWKLTGGAIHATDYSNACRTMLFNIHSLKWDEELLSLFNLKSEMMPKVISSNQIAGFTEKGSIFNRAIPIAGLLGDSHAALFGQNCFETGMAKATYGTGSSIMMNIGTKALDAPKGLVTSIGYATSDAVHYVFEGNIHATGDTLNWLKNELQLINSPAETEELATSIESTNGVYLVPAFVGLGAPYWDNQARASITGIGRDTTKAHIVRAALESITYQIKDLIDLMANQGGIDFKELRVDGGPTRNNFLMQYQADMLGRSVVRSNIEEISALGAAFMAGLATGFWKNIEEIKSLYQSDKSFEANMPPTEVSRLYHGWKNAVARTQFQA